MILYKFVCTCINHNEYMYVCNLLAEIKSITITKVREHPYINLTQFALIVFHNMPIIYNLQMRGLVKIQGYTLYKNRVGVPHVPPPPIWSIFISSPHPKNQVPTGTHAGCSVSIIKICLNVILNAFKHTDSFTHIHGLLLGLSQAPVSIIHSWNYIVYCKSFILIHEPLLWSSQAPPCHAFIQACKVK